MPIWRGFGRRFGELDAKIAEQLEIDAKYAVYLSRQAADVESYRRDESLVLPDDIDYAALPGLSNEVRAQAASPSAAHDRAGRPARRHHAGRVDAAGGAFAAQGLSAGRRRHGRMRKSRHG